MIFVRFFFRVQSYELFAPKQSKRAFFNLSGLTTYARLKVDASTLRFIYIYKSTSCDVLLTRPFVTTDDAFSYPCNILQHSAL